MDRSLVNLPRWRHLGSAVAELVFRNDCICCGRLTDFAAPNGLDRAGGLAGQALCVDCAIELGRAPERCDPRISVLPTFSCGPYGGAHRALVLAAKDHLCTSALSVMAAVWQASWEYLAAGGVLPSPQLSPVVLVPAPTRPSAAAARGGDIVTRAAELLASWYQRVGVLPVAYIENSAPDSVGLSFVQRRQLLTDDVNFAEAGVGVLKNLPTAGDR